MKRWGEYSKGSKAGTLGAMLGVLASVVLLFVPLSQYAGGSSGGGTSSGWGATGIGYLFGVPGADPALFFWGVVVLGASLVGGYGAISENRALVLIVAVVLLALTLLGLLSIGALVAPAALLFFLSGIWLGSASESSPGETARRRS